MAMQIITQQSPMMFVGGFGIHMGLVELLEIWRFVVVVVVVGNGRRLEGYVIVAWCW